MTTSSCSGPRRACTGAASMKHERPVMLQRVATRPHLRLWDLIAADHGGTSTAGFPDAAYIARRHAVECPQCPRGFGGPHAPERPLRIPPASPQGPMIGFVVWVVPRRAMRAGPPRANRWPVPHRRPAQQERIFSRMRRGAPALPALARLRGEDPQPGRGGCGEGSAGAPPVRVVHGPVHGAAARADGIPSRPGALAYDAAWFHWN